MALMETTRSGADGYPDQRDGRSGLGRTERLQELLVRGGNLTGSEARVMVALLGLRTGSLKQLSEATEISRSNIYPVLESVSAKGLCRRLPGKHAVWECPEPKEVFARLRQAEHARLQAVLHTAGRSLEEAEALVADPSSADEPPFKLVDDARLGVIYIEAMASVAGEVLVLNRGPYPGDTNADPVVLDALARGVRARALYVAAELEADEQLRQSAEIYAKAGVEERLVDHLPVSMALIGPDAALLSLPSYDMSSPLPAHAAAIRHPGMVELLSAAFEHLWEHARPYTS